MMFPDPSLLLKEVVPDSLHGLTARDILGDTWWDTTRKEAYETFGLKCYACGEIRGAGPAALHGHEIYEKVSPFLYVYTYTVALCPDCHNFIHCGRMVRLACENRVLPDDVLFNFFRGLDILKKAGLAPHENIVSNFLSFTRAFYDDEWFQYAVNYLDTNFPGVRPPLWHEVYLEVEGKRYPSLFSSREDHDTFYKDTPPERQKTEIKKRIDVATQSHGHTKGVSVKNNG